MAIYMIGYDLQPSKEEDYENLFTALEGIGSGLLGLPLFNVARYNGKNSHPNKG